MEILWLKFFLNMVANVKINMHTYLILLVLKIMIHHEHLKD